MPWTKTNYPDSMKNLSPRVRAKAIEIANALVEDTYEEGRAIAIATATAKKWAEGNKGSSQAKREHALHVVPHPQGWAVRRANSRHATFVFNSQDQARERALQIAEKEAIEVIVHGSNGEIVEHLHR